MRNLVKIKSISAHLRTILSLKSAQVIWHTWKKKEIPTMNQLHKRFSTEQVKELFQRYIDKKIERKYIEDILEIKKDNFSFS